MGRTCGERRASRRRIGSSRKEPPPVGEVIAKRSVGGVVAILPTPRKLRTSPSGPPGHLPQRGRIYPSGCSPPVGELSAKPTERAAKRVEPQLRPLLLRQLGRDQRVGRVQPVGDLGVVEGRQVVELHPFGASQVRGGNRPPRFRQHLEGDVRGLERHPALGRAGSHDGEHLVADLVDLVVAPLDGHGRRGQRHGGGVEGLGAHQASTPTPIGQVTPVPPMPQ